MQDIGCKLSRIAAVVVLLIMAFTAVGRAQGFSGGKPWQVGDVVICFGSGTCNVLRTSSGTAVLLDQFSDIGTPGVMSPGNTFGTAINNTLHLFTTDDGGNGSNVVEFTIASVNPYSGAPISHSVLTTFNGTQGNGSTGIRGVAIDLNGNMYVGNSNPATIVKLDLTGGSQGYFQIPSVSAPAWQSKTSYSLGATILDPDGHVQTVINSGSSGNNQPSWNDTGGTTKDTNVVWQDQGWPVGGPCIDNTLNSLDLSSDGNNVYFTSAPGGIIQTVATSFGSSACSVFADFGPTVTLSGIRVVPNGSVVNCKSGVSSCSLGGDGVLVVATGTVDSDLGPPDNDTGESITDICTGSTTPSGTSCALLLNSSGAIVAKYPVQGSLQALTLDPLARSCVNTDGTPGSNCATTATIKNFWVADSASDAFYKVDFQAGGVTTFHANDLNCTSCATVSGIQGLGIYGGEGANQPQLNQLFQGSIRPPTNANPNLNTQKVQFPLPLSPGDTNSMTVTGYGLSGTTPLNLYASLIPSSTGKNDFGAKCNVTTTNFGDTCILWKADIDIPASVRFTQKFFAPTGVDPGTDVFVDEAFDTTTSLNPGDPTSYRSSVHSLHEILNSTGGNELPAGCTYSSPLAKQCFQSPNNVTFKFTCTSYPGSTIQNYAGGNPRLVIVQSPFPLPSTTPAPLPLCQGNTLIPCVLSGTGGTTNWRIGNNQWTFNWNVAGIGTYNACTFDDTHTNIPFCVPFTVQKSCK